MHLRVERGVGRHAEGREVFAEHGRCLLLAQAVGGDQHIRHPPLHQVPDIAVGAACAPGDAGLGDEELAVEVDEHAVGGALRVGREQPLQVPDGDGAVLSR